MSDEQSELQRLREEVRQLRERVEELSKVVDRLGSAGEEAGAGGRTAAAPPVISAVPPVIQAPPVVSTPAVGSSPFDEAGPMPARPAAKESLELRFGTVWLPRIGIAALLTGMVFFAAYITPRLSVPQKVGLGYLLCVVLGGLGLWLERRTPQFARVLQAGALALGYFVTYAAHFVEAFRVIESPAAGLAALSVVVLFIVGVAVERKSPALAGMALFFGYYTSVASGVTAFTLAANAVLALAALFFLARNRWVPISYGAVLATYLAYMLWVWRLSRWGEVQRLIFDSGYLGAEEFWLRAAFLSLYWLLFAGGGLLVRGDAMTSAERNGLLTLNNVFFFVLFTLLMHHGYPQWQWRFQFCFGGALLVASAFAYRRSLPERGVMEALFAQGVLVATLGLVSYLEGGRLVAAMAVESLLLLVLARWMNGPWVAWIGRLTFAVAVAAGWPRGPDVWTMWFAAAIGYACVQVERARRERVAGALYFAVAATALAMRAAEVVFDPAEMPWVWLAGAVLVAGIGGFLRAREIVWASHLPLAWVYVEFLTLSVRRLDELLGLVAVVLGFGVGAWAAARARDDAARATVRLVVYLVFAMAVAFVASFEHCSERWLLSVLAGQALVLVIAGALAKEKAFAWAGAAAVVAGLVGYFSGGAAVFEPARAAWTNLMAGVAMLVAAERTLKRSRLVRGFCPGLVVAVAAVGIFALRKLVGGALLTVSWAVLGFVMLAFGFAVKSRAYRLAGLAAVGCSIVRALVYDLARVGTGYRIVSFIGLGVILLVLAFLYAKNREKIAKWL